MRGAKIKEAKLGTKVMVIAEITPKERRFAEEWVKDYDTARAFTAAGFTAKNANSIAARASAMRQTKRVWDYIQELQKDVEKVTGITRAQILQQHRDIAYTSIAHLHKTWIKREEFENLTDQQKAAIQEIDTKIVTLTDPKGKKIGTKEYVRIKLYDRQKSLDAISRMVGYDSPTKFELGGNKELIEGLFPFGK